MKIPIYQVDAFSDELFKGNPAAVCPLDNWIDTEIMQKVAFENNLSETAFFVKEAEGQYHIRWFTPLSEVDLCGHATLAAAHILFKYTTFPQNKIKFTSKSGDLFVSKKEDLLWLDFPVSKMKKVSPPLLLIEGIGINPLETYEGTSDIMAVLNNEYLVRKLHPKIEILERIKTRGVIITAKGNTTDFVSRFFAPRVGVVEDPVTGSAHTLLTPFWAAKLQKKHLKALQLSERGGQLECILKGKRVHIGGSATTFLEGSILV